MKRLQWTKMRRPGTCLTCQEIWSILNYACMLLILLTMGVGGLAANAPLSMSPPSLLFPHQFTADSGTAAAALANCTEGGTTLLFAPQTPDTRAAVTNATALAYRGAGANFATGPYSSSLTKLAVLQTDADDALLMAPSASSTSSCSTGVRSSTTCRRRSAARA